MSHYPPIYNKPDEATMESRDLLKEINKKLDLLVGKKEDKNIPFELLGVRGIVDMHDKHLQEIDDDIISVKKKHNRLVDRLEDRVKELEKKLSFSKSIRERFAEIDECKKTGKPLPR